jgi:ATP-dependent Clp protease, protease subunit
LGKITKFFSNFLAFCGRMEKLFITGIIRSASDASQASGEKSFSYEDLENFLNSRSETGPFLAVIESPGGSVDEGFRIYNRLKEEGADTFAVRANSIASIIFLAGKNRLIAPDAEMIIHNAWVDPADLEGEALNYYSAKMLVDYFAETDTKILDVYAQFAGADKVQELLALMAVDTNLGADRAIGLGFATAIQEAPAKAQNLKRKVLTFSQNFIDLIEQEKSNNMKTEEKVTALEKLFKGLARAFKLTAKNMVVTTTEGVELFVNAEGDELVGATAFIAEEGVPTETPAPAGSHTLSDGTVISVGEGGVIAEALAPESIDDLKAKYEEEKMALEQEKKELEARVLALTRETNETKATFEKLQKDFLNLKNEVLGDPDKKKTAAPSAEELAKMSVGERIKMRALNKVTN